MNYFSFNFKNLLVIVQTDVDRVVLISALLDVEIPVLTIDKTIEIMEKIQCERHSKKIHGKISRT
jgi:hypothetical protein